ncbi:MAG: D-alanine--D-alanine ligase [Alphaproteobacteria bacterium]|nr:D-alanine--D-alanine ligase [Alphaproteobacteria bacterium]
MRDIDRKSVKILVLSGGWSSEREVSLVSGKNCADALQASGWNAQFYDLTGNVIGFINDLVTKKPDLVFNALHGTYGEDGAIAGLLNMMGIAYTHSGIAASAVAMDKLLTKQFLAPLGIKFAESYDMSGVTNNLAGLKKQCPLTPPYVLKPIRDGSSRGIYIIGADNIPDMSEEKNMSQDYMAESYVSGSELTVAVLDNYGALGVTELVPKQGFYDYHAKYNDGVTTHICPAQISEKLEAKCRAQAKIAHDALGCKQVSRSDFRYDEDNDTLYFLEINTHPGMTSLSLVPEQAKLHGIAFTDLCDLLVEGALDGRREA